jgi:archaellum component FlaC
MPDIFTNNTLSILPYIVAAIAGLWGFWRKMEKNQQDAQIRSVRMEDRLHRIESQFGPNGGGLREAVNRISETVNKMDNKLDSLGRELSQLKGEYEQHIRENVDE